MISDSKSVGKNGECMGGEFVRICIHKGIIYDPYGRDSSGGNVKQMA